MDFADFRLPWGKRHALIVVLGYSRRMWLRFYECQTMPVVMRGLERSFAYFVGVPSELLFDQMRAVITDDKRHEGGRLTENPEFLRFRGHWRFRTRACRPYRAQTTVERLPASAPGHAPAPPDPSAPGFVTSSPARYSRARSSASLRSCLRRSPGRRWIKRTGGSQNPGRKSSKVLQDCTICASCRLKGSGFAERR